MSKEECCEQYCNLDIGDDPNKFFRMNNNQWEGTGSCVWIDKAVKKLGWSWNSSGGWLYPSTIVGNPQYNWGSGTWPTAFPIKYSNINTLTAELEFTRTQTPQGWYNLAFDIYWTPQNTWNRKYNIMIWFYGELGNWNGETVNDGYNDYTVHIFDKGWPYVAFVLKNQNVNITYYKVNIKSLMNQIKSSWHGVGIDGNWYIPSLEFGTEVNGGSGAITINKLNIELNGDTISLNGDITNGPCGQPTCYKCTGTSCGQDNVNGTYTTCTPNPCTTNGPCGQPTCYKCTGTSCGQDNVNGTYTTCTPNPCTTNGPCGQPTCYKCTGTSCGQDDANGTYTTCSPNPCSSGGGSTGTNCLKVGDTCVPYIYIIIGLGVLYLLKK